MSDTTAALQRMADELDRVLRGSQEEAEAFYRARAVEVGRLLDRARDALPQGDQPLASDQRALHDAAELVGHLYAALAAWVLTGEAPEGMGRGR
ncbi:hypothetical protein ACN2MM_07110 [Alkalilimnicola ehrlichii MLHE-1]|uniref:Uncharacterized protein n=1 Tax=Alkalilimnicola ehrlichii (strain ATCC BAA-1101 / DSM 17681 / MLHE-1) TaxID=187272 RepID=Q0A947_ALKEH|nr:hypothetical protein [Alkalilimnicola ehrlichii]ABI56640.1 hypothetical protein Mlg_1291 [Alkalilimnicola ehrlichii MLHE-1]